MCFDICTINIRVSIRVRGLHLVFFPVGGLGVPFGSTMFNRFSSRQPCGVEHCFGAATDV